MEEQPQEANNMASVCVLSIWKQTINLHYLEDLPLFRDIYFLIKNGKNALKLFC